MSVKRHHPTNIILAVDGSENSLIAAGLLRDLPLLSDTKITSISVVPSRYVTNQSVQQALLVETQKFFSDAKIPIETKLLHGHPAESIVAFAEKTQPDLIIMGARGLRATLGILLGGVVQQVVEHACCPVLVVRAPFTGLRRILIATDNSPESQSAVEYIKNFPLPKDTEIIVLHVLPPSPTPELIARSWAVPLEAINPIALQEIEESIQRSAEEEKTQAQDELDRVIKSLKESGRSCQSVICDGDAATEILDFIKNNEIDLVLTGSRGLSQVRGWLLGSVSRKLVHYANCSVLIVKGNPDEQTQ